MQVPEPKDGGAGDEEVEPKLEEPRLIGTFAAARSASARDTFNTLEVGPRWTFSS